MRKVVEVGGEGGEGGEGREEEVVAIAGGGELLLAFADQGVGEGTGGVSKPTVWVAVKGGGRGGLSRGMSRVGSRGRTAAGGGKGVCGGGGRGAYGRVLWVGLSLNLSQIVAHVHRSPPWVPKVFVYPSLPLFLSLSAIICDKFTIFIVTHVHSCPPWVPKCVF
jgi:hypothetical protein